MISAWNGVYTVCAPFHGTWNLTPDVRPVSLSSSANIGPLKAMSQEGCVSGASIFRASQTGDILRVKELISRGISVNRPNPYGCVPLHYAVKHAAECAAVVARGGDGATADQSKVGVPLCLKLDKFCGALDDSPISIVSPNRSGAYSAAPLFACEAPLLLFLHILLGSKDSICSLVTPPCRRRGASEKSPDPCPGSSSRGRVPNVPRRGRKSGQPPRRDPPRARVSAHERLPEVTEPPHVHPGLQQVPGQRGHDLHRSGGEFGREKAFPWQAVSRKRERGGGGRAGRR